jgi:hypothetical protein
MRSTGTSLLALVWVSVVAAFFVPGDASIRYWLSVAAHALNGTGFILAAIADKIGGRQFSGVRVVYVLAVEIMLAILGRVVMSAAAAAN